MRVFVTGASGWIGSAAVDELLAAGHEVVGLARSDASAAALAAKGADGAARRPRRPRRASAPAPRGRGGHPPRQQARLRAPAAPTAAERGAVETIGDALAGTGRPFLLASGCRARRPGGPPPRTTPSPFHGPDAPRGGSENLALDFAERGVHTVALRFAPTVHGVGDHGFIAALAAVAREKGVAGYLGDGTNRWAAVHRVDAARLVALGLEKAPAGARLHAVAEEGVADPRDRGGDRPRLGLPVASIARRRGPTTSAGSGCSSAWTSPRQRADPGALGWTPTGPTLVEDIAAGAYPA